MNDSDEGAPDPGLEKSRRRALETLASGKAGGDLAEMARELLAGSITPRGIIESGIYDEAFNQTTPNFTDWYQGLSEEEKDSAAAHGREALDNLLREELPGRAAQSQEPEPSADGGLEWEGDEEEPPDSWLI